MTHTITPDRRQLIISVDADEQKELREWPRDRNLPDHTPDSIGSDDAMHEFLEPLTRNSELEWIPEGTTDDLTSAPILGILGEVQRDDATPRGYGGPKINAGCGMFQPILERWAFMDYQVRSVLEDLRDKGQAVFVS